MRESQFGLKFLETLREESYGAVVVFEDLYGNKRDQLEPRGSSKP